MIRILFSLSALLLGTLKAQDASGTISGKIVDQADRPIPQASVTLSLEGAPESTVVLTDAIGTFRSEHLAIGQYSVRVEKAGFQTVLRHGDVIKVNVETTIVVRLLLGEHSEVVTVNADGPKTLALGVVMDSAVISPLPLLDRNVLGLTFLMPGVTAGAGGNNVNASLSGQREFSTSVVLNGIEVTSNRNNDTDVRPSLQAVEEFQVSPSGYPADIGMRGSGVISITTKSGSNTLHGSVYEFLRVPSLATRSFFSETSPQSGLNDFGASLGGPVVKDKTHFFVSYEQKHQWDKFSYLTTTVPKQMVNVLPDGSVDLSGLVDPLTGNRVPIFDPLAYQSSFVAAPFPNNLIPATRVSRAGLNVLQSLFPQPNVPGILNGWVNNFRVSQPYHFNSNTGDARVDHRVGVNSTLEVTYDNALWNSLTADPFAGAIPVAGGGGADNGGSMDSSNLALGLSLTTRRKSNQTNNLRLSLVKTHLAEDTLIGSDVSNQFGIGNISVHGYPATVGLPQFFLGFGATAGGSTFKPLTFSDRNISLGDTYTLNARKHNVRLGYEFRNLVAHPGFSLFPTSYQYYNGAYASLTSDPTFSFFDPSAYYGNGGSEIADLLLGLPGFVARGLQFTTPTTESLEHNLFFEDTWRLTDAVTLDFGLRYQYQSPYRETQDQQANFNLGTMSLLLAGKGPNSRSLINPDRNNFAPHFGFAIRVGQRTVLRGGYSLAFTPEDAARSDLLTGNYPFAVSQQFSNTSFSPTTYVLDQGIPRPSGISIPAGASSIGLATLGATSGQTLISIDPNFRTGYIHLLNFLLERRFTEGVTLQVGYVGALSRKLPYEIGNLNLAGRVSPLAGPITGLFSEGSGAYHSFQATLQKRYSASFGFSAAYTYAKDLDNGPAPLVLGRNHQAPQDPWNLAEERGPAATDVRHTLVVTHQWDLPLKNLSGIRYLSGRATRAAFLGWQLSGIATLRSGLPVNVIRNGNVQGYEGLRPNVVGNPNLDPSARTLTQYFSTHAFSVAGLGPTQPGNSGRNTVRGPGLVNFDLRLAKSFPIRAGTSLEVRMEGFNVANTPHFANPATDMSLASFGTITQTIGTPRILQFSGMLKF